MDIGFTGTRKGMSRAQQVTLRDILSQYSGLDTLHHGDCVGSDAQADSIAHKLSLLRCIHPPSETKYRAYCTVPNGAIGVLKPRPYLVRDRNIAVHSDFLIVTPKESYMPRSTRGSGTWYTAIYMKLSLSKPVKVIWPNGDIKDW